MRGYGRRKAVDPLEITARERERMEAVEEALLSVGTDFEDENFRKRLRAAVLLTLENERANPYHRLGVDAIGRAEFYQRRDRLLADIAVRLDLI